MNWKSVGEGIAGVAHIAFALLTPMLRAWRCRRGATEEEILRTLPGDDLVPNPQWRWTHAITIDAPASEVWAWLVQIGQGRGGFYSYESLENLIGCDIHNADRIIPELQNLQVGDGVRLHPNMDAIPVAMIEPQRALVLHAITDMRTGKTFDPVDELPDSYMATCWMWFLEERVDGTTRLITRFQNGYNPTLANKLMYGPIFVEPIGFVMDRKMLLGIKERAEAAVSGRRATS